MWQDVLYVVSFALASAALSDWCWLTVLAIPAYAGYMLGVHVFLPAFMRQQNTAMPADQRKRLEKAEQRAEKRRAKAGTRR
jgi:hypothetical protein